MAKTIYEHVMEFKKKYPMTFATRLKKHCAVAQEHLNPGEEVYYAFCGQKNKKPSELFETAVFVLTSKRIIIAQKRVLFGYFYRSITPDLFNDLFVHKHIIWGSVEIDTVKEVIDISNLDKKALPEIETVISEYIASEKPKYPPRPSE